MLDIFFYEVFKEEEIELKRFLPHNIRADFAWETIQEYSIKEPLAPIISIRTQSKIPNLWATKLKGILTRSTGYDHITTFLKNADMQIPCGYLPKYCSRAVAEQAALLWMSLMRKLRQQIENFSTFNRDGLTGLETENKTLLVVGVGNIGYEIIKIGKGLGMNVLGVDIVEKHPSVRYVPIQEGIVHADVIACAMNLTSENIGYFSYDLLKQAKRGAIFINIARGELSPSRDLLQLVEENHLGGIGLDVYSSESDLAISLRSHTEANTEEIQLILKLSKFPNVILTPHNAFNTREAVIKKAEQSVQQIKYFIENDKFLWQVPY